MIMKQLKWRFTILMFFIFTIFSLFLFLNNRHIISELKDRTAKDNQVNIEKAMTQLESELRALENLLFNMPSENRSFEIVKRSDQSSAEKRNEYTLAYTNCIAQIKKVSSYNQTAEGTFAYYPQQALFFNQGIDESLEQELKHLLTQTDAAAYGQWIWVQSGGQYYLSRIYKNDGYDLGVCISVEHLINSLWGHQTALNEILFVNGDGIVLNHNPRYENLTEIENEKIYTLSASSNKGNFSILNLIDESYFDTAGPPFTERNGDYRTGKS